MMSPNPQYMDLHRLEHQQRLDHAAKCRMRPCAPNRLLLAVGAALVALGERVQAQAIEDARRMTAGRTATLTNELHQL
jgi:hypothetical protein